MKSFCSLVVAVIVVLAALCALFSRSASHPTDVVVNAATHVDLAADDADNDSTGEVDLFGNDVTDAVARYRFDATGSLYEVHSPQTEIPKLGSPKS